MSGGNPQWVEAAMRLLPPERHARALKYRKPEDRLQCVVAYLLLRLALKKERGITFSEDLTYTKDGKPYLSQYPNIEISLSHCRQGVACVVADSPVGVDIEERQPLNADMVEYCCSAEEKREIAAASDPATAFTSIWTRKESFLKRLGAAAPRDLTAIPHPSAEFHTILTERYICTLCGENCREAEVERVAMEDIYRKS